MKNYDGKGVSFAKRISVLRSIGLGVGFFSVAAGMYPLNLPGWVWPLVVFHGFIWPPIALQLAKRAKQPYQAEHRNLLLDSLAGGFWAGAMGFNPLPSVTILAMMAMHNIAVGGPRVFVHGSIAQVAGALVAMLVFSPTLVHESTPIQVYACLLMLVIYPLAVGLACYQLALKLSEHKRILGKLSRTDSLTGLINHGSWKDLLQIEFGNCQVLSRQSSIVLIDVDHFKAINDTHGHLMGDKVLKELSRGLLTSLRETDLAGRYGGDELCVILPNTSVALAHEMLERLRREVYSYRDERLPGLHVTLSIGIAAYQPHITDAAMWLNEADKALYTAKTTGRNRTCTAEATPQGPISDELEPSVF